ncbi:MAG: FAD-binding protein [Rhizobiales bacterium]|nr:FAD-binding protein [Hyphomicrobiales bacterium]
MKDRGGAVIRDFRSYDGHGDLACDVCIAGAGAAGVALALTLAERGHRVILLEAGGFDYDEADQAPYIGANIGRPYHEISTTRLRFSVDPPITGAACARLSSPSTSRSATGSPTAAGRSASTI